MSLYPSLEDLQVDKLATAQRVQEMNAMGVPPYNPYAAVQAPPPTASHSQPASLHSSSSSLYSGLGLEEFMGNYGGLDIRTQAIQSYVPQDVAAQLLSPPRTAAITPVGDRNLARAAIQQGVREVVLAKDQAGKLGICVTSIDKGIFVSFVWAQSAASLAGLRFGDQILQINGENVAGWTTDKATKFLQKVDGVRVSLAVRDRPFERTITVIKDSHNHIGFLYKNGQVTAIVKDSSAARNGVLTHHQLTEVNGQNVVGLKDEQLLKILAEASQSVTLTFMPSFVYDHLVKHIGFEKLKKFMDHSIPDY